MDSRAKENFRLSLCHGLSCEILRRDSSFLRGPQRIEAETPHRSIWSERCPRLDRRLTHFLRNRTAHSFELGGAGDVQGDPDASAAWIRSPVTGLNHSTL